MTKDEHKKIVTRLMGMVAPEHQADASELFTTLSDDYDVTIAEGTKATTRISELSENNEKLRKVNTDLLLKVGVTKKETKENKTDDDDNGMKNMPTFESLFNEKGELI